jgi:hypothetical protein
MLQISFKTKKSSSFLMKLDLEKAYDKVRWIYVRLSLIQLGLNLQTVNWVMGCLKYSSLVILINDSPFSFIHPSGGIREGCPLSPFIFPLVVDGLSQLIAHANERNVVKGLKMSHEC